MQDTLQSILNQTYKNIELIVIDDGSSDNTWQKIEELQTQCEKRFVRVIMQTKENEGTCATLNKMLDLAQGEFIYLIASDDIAKPQAIEKEVAFLESHNDYALVVGDDELIDSQGKIFFGIRIEISFMISTKLHLKLLQNFCTMIQKSIFIQMNLDDTTKSMLQITYQMAILCENLSLIK